MTTNLLRFVHKHRLTSLLLLAAVPIISIFGYKKYNKELDSKKHQIVRGKDSLFLILRSFSRTVVVFSSKVFMGKEKSKVIEEQMVMKNTEDVVNTLGNMKGALMKLGQLASFIDDGLPENVRESLKQLQTQAPPMSYELVEKIFIENFDMLPTAMFRKFEKIPIAAASIGQVHKAVTLTGEKVAVKVQYPNIASTIEADLANLDLTSLFAPLLWKGLDLKSLVEELKVRLLEEVDYLNEAKNQQMFYEYYLGHPFIKIPKVYFEYSNRYILTSEFVNGSSFDELLTWPQTQKDLAAETIYRFSFRSIYRLKAFNGDPHPGNYLFHRNGKVTFLDFGLVKLFSDDELSQLTDIWKYTLFEYDVDKLRSAVENAGFLMKNAPVTNEELIDFMEVFIALVAKNEELQLTPEYASEIARRVLFGRASHKEVVKYANIPSAYAILQRINLGLIAILGSLYAKSNWRSISEEMWPSINGEPITDLGKKELIWLESKNKAHLLS